MVVKLEPGITLSDVENADKLPFLIAAELDNGEEEFLCPVIGELEPRGQQSMCKDSYVSSKNRVLRVAIMGLSPWFAGENRSDRN